MIKFPRVHIAKSVVNRILNMADGMPNNAAPKPMAPRVPDTMAQGANLDAALSSPLDAALPGIDNAPEPGATASGKPLLDTLMQPGQ